MALECFTLGEPPPSAASYLPGNFQRAPDVSAGAEPSLEQVAAFNGTRGRIQSESPAAIVGCYNQLDSTLVADLFLIAALDLLGFKRRQRESRQLKAEEGESRGDPYLQ
jgi:hypothetical protein